MPTEQDLKFKKESSKSTIRWHNETVERQKPEGKNVIRKFAFATRVGYHPQNPNKVNQDSYILQPNIQGTSQVHLFGICDGHGQFGRNVSNFVKAALSGHIERKYTQGLTDEQIVPVMKEIFESINREIEMNVPNCQFSGTTCSIVLSRGPQIVAANAGDSRSIVVNSKGIAKALTNDHKPDLPEERTRINEYGGRVRPIISNGQEAGPARVWLKTADIPGLAMSRSLGDYVAQSIGVSPIPEVTFHEVVADDRFIVIASDGVWEFLSNQEVADIVIPFYEQGAAE